MQSSRGSIYLDRLADALTQAVDDERIGIPRFIRWLDRVESSDSLEASLSSATGICNRIFGGAPVRENRTGDGVLHGSIHVVWANGSSALISAGPAGDPAMNAGPEIMLLGSSGAMYFDGAAGGSATAEQVGRG